MLTADNPAVIIEKGILVAKNEAQAYLCLSLNYRMHIPILFS